MIIGRPETAMFLAVPLEAVEILDCLAKGQSIGEAADFYQKKYGETPDMDDLLSILESKGIIQSGLEEGARAARHSAHRVHPPVAYHFNRLSSLVAKRIFSGYTLAACFLVVTLAVVVVIRHPFLVVAPHDLYFPDHRALSWTILTAATLITLFLHELAHLVAAKAAGINSRMGISHRLWYVVAETDLTGLWSVPKQKRYLPLLAGMLLDIVSASLLVLLLFCQEERWLLLSPLATQLLRAMLFIYLGRVAWQCFFFIRTDFYYVIANFFNCRNLLGDTEVYLRNQLANVVPMIRPVDQSAVPESERRVIRVYAWFWVAGRIAAFVTLLVVTFPLAGRYIENLAGVFRIGYSANRADFVDAFLLASYFFIPFVIGLTLWIGGMVRRERT